MTKIKNLIIITLYFLIFLINEISCKARGANDGLGKGGGGAAHIKLTPADKAAAAELKDPKAPLIIVCLVFSSPCIFVSLLFCFFHIRDKYSSTSDDEFVSVK